MSVRCVCVCVNIVQWFLCDAIEDGKCVSPHSELRTSNAITYIYMYIFAEVNIEKLDS